MPAEYFSSEGPRPWMVSGSATMPVQHPLEGPGGMMNHSGPPADVSSDIMGYDPGSSLGAPL